VFITGNVPRSLQLGSAPINVAPQRRRLRRLKEPQIAQMTQMERAPDNRRFPLVRVQREV